MRVVRLYLVNCQVKGRGKAKLLIIKGMYGLYGFADAKAKIGCTDARRLRYDRRV